MLYVKCLARKGKAEIGKGDFIVKVPTTYCMQIKYMKTTENVISQSIWLSLEVTRA